MNPLANAPSVPQDASEALQVTLNLSTACRRCHEPRSTQERAVYGPLCETCWAVWQQEAHGFSAPRRFGWLSQNKAVRHG